MRRIARVLIFALAAALTTGPALMGCDDDSKNDNNASMIMLASLSPEEPAIYLYSAGTHDGNLGSRSNADFLCRYAAVGIKTVWRKSANRAFISFSDTDRIKDLVAAPYNTLPVYGIKSNGATTLLKNTWDDLWTDSGINERLDNALGIPSGNWWSGSSADGTSSGDNCGSWTSDSAGISGGRGSAFFSDTHSWLISSYQTCDTQQTLLCVAY